MGGCPGARARRAAPGTAFLFLMLVAGPVAAAPPRPHPGRPVAAGAARLFVETEGTGPPLVLLPAFPGVDHAWFHPYFSTLAPDATVIYYDPAGCGRSDPMAAGRATLDAAVEDLEALRAALGHGRIDLLGQGFGATVAILYADRHPGRAGRIVLIGPTPRAGTFLDSPGLQRAVTPEMREAIEAAGGDRYLSADGRLRQRLRALAPLLFRRLTDRGFHRAFADGLTVSAAVYDGHSAGEQPDLIPALRRLRSPLLIVAGRHDPTAPIQEVETVRDAVRGARLVILEESGAVPFADQPVEFQKAVRDFLGAGPGVTTAPSGE